MDQLIKLHLKSKTSCSGHSSGGISKAARLCRRLFLILPARAADLLSPALKSRILAKASLAAA
jgi:hypothetical protein